MSNIGVILPFKTLQTDSKPLNEEIILDIESNNQRPQRAARRSNRPNQAPIMQVIEAFEDMNTQDRQYALAAVGCLVLGLIGALLIANHRDLTVERQNND